MELYTILENKATIVFTQNLKFYGSLSVFTVICV